MFNKLSFSRPTRAPTNLADRRNYQDACVRIFVQVVIRCQESFMVGHMKYHGRLIGAWYLQLYLVFMMTYGILDKPYVQRF
jgi:hypothetical protein